jgi:hypothetical protein
MSGVGQLAGNGRTDAASGGGDEGDGGGGPVGVLEK